jgi:hypothetical protein
MSFNALCFVLYAVGGVSLIALVSLIFLLYDFAGMYLTLLLCYICI